MINSDLFLPNEKPITPSDFSFATVATVSDDGITLIFDGQTTPTTKKYRFNKSATFAIGDRVKIFRDSGTYVVEYPLN